MKKAVQKYSKSYVQWSKKLSPQERARFVEDFMKLANQSSKEKSKLISMKIPQDLLKLFRLKCESENIAYQTQIKKLMHQWLVGKS